MQKRFIRPAISLLLGVVTILSIVFPAPVGAVFSGYKKDTVNAAATLSPSIIYKSHVQDIGWMGCMRDGETAGTVGQALRMEAIRIKVRNVQGGVEYSTHVQDIGWTDYAANGALSGTEGRSLRLEAIKIRLTGDALDKYDVYYRIHAENIGWLDWAKNGSAAGTAGFGYRMEAIQIVLVEKGEAPPGATARVFAEPEISYQSYIQDNGWQENVKNGETSGTSGQALRMEAVRIGLMNLSGSVEYRTHIQNIGWTDFAADGAMSGTAGQSLRMEAVEIRLTCDAASRFDVYYRVHAENLGWLDWAENGASAGTTGFSYRMEAIQIVLVLKGGPAPGATARPFEKSAAVSSRQPMVALTFDDGPYSVVDSSILNTLSAYGAHATFFVAGYRIAEYSDTILEIYSQGSEIGNHTYSHHNLSSLSASDIRSEIARTDQLIFNLTGVYPALIRPPEGSYNSTVLNTVDRPIVMWSVDTRDWKTRSTSSTISSVLNNVQDGDIVLMHSLYPSTAAACETIIPELVARGYKLVTVSELMAARGVTADAGKVISSARP
ncbi:MAG: polysaccharide deacetylase family protein [Eubacteriales bacterium]